MITRRLPCNLNDVDVLDRGQKLANAEHDYGRVDAEKKTANDNFKKSLDAIEGRISELSAAIRDRVETRDVECIIQDDNLRMMKEVVRVDTNEVVESYPFTEKECQGTLI